MIPKDRKRLAEVDFILKVMLEDIPRYFHHRDTEGTEKPEKPMDSSLRSPCLRGESSLAADSVAHWIEEDITSGLIQLSCFVNASPNPDCLM